VRRALCLALALLGALPTAAQFGERIEVHLISIYATAYDGKGNQIQGLTKDDFEVLEDGRAQNITHFVEMQGRTPVQMFTMGETVQPKPDEPLPPRTQELLAEKYVFYIDNLNIDPIQRNQMMDKLDAFIQERFTGTAQGMVATFDRKLNLRTPFTTDAAVLLQALDEAKMLSGEAAARRQSKVDVIDRLQEEGTTFNQAVAIVSGYAQEVRHETNIALKVLQDFLLVLSGVTGRKSLVYVCSGLPQIPGMELYDYLRTMYPDKNSMIFTSNNDLTPTYKGVINTANASGVSFFTLDVSGLRSLGGQGIAENKTQAYELSTTLEAHNLTDMLSTMAEETGGVPIINSNDFAKGLRKVGTALDNYYFLGYQRNRSMEDRIHKLEVRLKGKKAYQVSYRRGFMDKSLVSASSDALISALVLPVVENPHGARVEFANPRRLQKEAFALPVSVIVPFDAVTLLPQGGSWVGELRFGFVSQDESGERSEVSWKAHPFSIPDAAWKGLKGKEFTYKAELAILPGASVVAVAVVNPTDSVQSIVMEKVVISTKGRSQ
jgi:VWFA-related protein